jgi:hypothetical protein
MKCGVRQAKKHKTTTECSITVLFAGELSRKAGRQQDAVSIKTVALQNFPQRINISENTRDKNHPPCFLAGQLRGKKIN